MIKDTDLAWLAGILDGEGNIGIYKRNGKRSTYEPRVHLVNTNLEMVDKAKSIYEELKIGCKIALKAKEKRKEFHKQAYVISINSGENLTVVLNSVLPYLVAKKQQAQLVLDWIEIREGQADWNGYLRGVPYGSELIEIYNQLRKLNKTGALDETGVLGP